MEPCYCYYFFTTEGDLPLSIDYTSCENESSTIQFTKVGYNRICAQFINVVDPVIPFYNSGLECVDGKCPNYCCECYNVTNISEGTYELSYLNCDLSMSTITIDASQTIKICALNVPINDSISITLNGPCYNGECVTATEDLLLYDVLTTLGPCPDICCGKSKLGNNLSNDTGNASGTYSIR